jgi:enamine deaminase RidA (YjgF/YER057c/UK114 family)
MTMPADSTPSTSTPKTSPEDTLQALGIDLPEPTAPLASYIPARTTGKRVLISGQVPIKNGAMMATGSVPETVSIETATECARQCAINALAAVRSVAGDLDQVAGVVRLGGFVACGPGFGNQPEIINGASDLMLEVFGDKGRHARAAVGVSSLPRNAPVEIEFEFELA